MSERKTGLYRFLELPRLYEAVQSALMSSDARVRVQQEYLRPFPGGHILDVGCGTGSLVDELPGTVEYTGVDPNPAYIATAKKRYGARGRFMVGRIGDDLPLRAEGYDVVVARGVLHHLSDEECCEFARGCKRWLRPGGVVFAIDPVFHPKQNVLARLAAALDRGRHVRDCEGYCTLLRSGGLSRIEPWIRTDMLRIPYSHHIVRAGIAES